MSDKKKCECCSKKYDAKVFATCKDCLHKWTEDFTKPSFWERPCPRCSNKPKDHEI